MASRGLRDMGQGPEPIADPEELRFVRRQGARVAATAMGMAVLATTLVLIPR